MFKSLRNILQNSNVAAMETYTINYGLTYDQIKFMNKRAASFPVAGFSASELYSELARDYGFPYAGENSDNIIGSRNSRRGN